MNYRSGTTNLRSGNKFLYEVCLYKDYKDRMEIVDSRFYSTDKPISFNSYKGIKMDGYVLVKTISWLEAPLDYLISNGFREVEDNADNKRRKTKRKTK